MARHPKSVLLAALLPLIFSPMKLGAANATIGPWNGFFIAAGKGIHKALPVDAPVLADSKWTMFAYVNQAGAASGNTSGGNALIAGFGSLTDRSPRYLAIANGNFAYWGGATVTATTSPVTAAAWHMLAATFDGTQIQLYLDGARVASQTQAMTPVTPTAQLAPEPIDQRPWAHFSGKIAAFTVLSQALSAPEIEAMHAHPPDFDLIEFQPGSLNWPVQTRAQAGEKVPQDPSTLPHSPTAFSNGVAKPALHTQPAIDERGDHEWAITGGWKLAAAPTIQAAGDQISQPAFSFGKWLNATVPGTVLTTYIDRGVYPDPDYGLNNLAIPESLNKQDYWYRTEFPAPPTGTGRRLTLTFHGINYAAAVWLNGHHLGDIKGAFIRGTFDVTAFVHPGSGNTLAVRISPPPHPGIPSEQSIKFGPGDNGGLMCLDGPTFIATEGWDWIPGIRDRNSGIWQEVTLGSTGAVGLGDSQVVTHLSLPSTTSADVSIAVPLSNHTQSAVHGTLQASFEGVRVSKAVTLPPGETQVNLTSAEFAQLLIANPRLWWPNGYGSPELYHLKLSFNDAKGESDTKTLRFGIREITYELSLADSLGALRRVEFSPTVAHGANQRIVNGTHEGLVDTPSGWVASLVAGAENSKAVHPAADALCAPFLVIRVNGVKIACKGGNWGMDDSRKRVSRDHLEPFFRLHRDAHLNIIRNWCGQSTEQVFFNLADEYGLLVWNDFWDSTENYNLEPDDSALFLGNARDTILRYRNHPSIVIWCGRNEGVPPPAINKGLEDLVNELDGTRYYTGSSNEVNLHSSGPYRFQDPSRYFTALSRGFAVELGVPSFPTIDTLRNMMPVADQWPPNDTWAYHDWHTSGNGATAPFNEAMAAQLGKPADLEDFNRKAQMLDYDQHRAIFEGFNAHLWAPNSGRMLWMTQPAWPSTMWQIFSSDYDTQGSFYGVKIASEPVHVQMNLPDFKTVVVNNTGTALENLNLRARVFTVDGKQLWSKEEKVSAGANAEADSFMVEMPPSFATQVSFVKLELADAHGTLLSQNFYWESGQTAGYRALSSMPAITLTAAASEQRSGDSVLVAVKLSNQTANVAVMTKLTLRHSSDHTRILPAYYSDNYVSLLPGETRDIQVEAPAGAAAGNIEVGLSGWNIQPVTAQSTRAQ